MKKRKRKALRIVVGIMSAPFVLLALLVALLYVPPVQQWAVRRATEYVRESTGWDVSIERVRLTWVLDLDLQNLRVENEDLHLQARHVGLDLDFSRAFHLQLGVEGIVLRQADVDTRTLIETLQVKGKLCDFHLQADKVDLKRQKVYLNRAVLEGADVAILMRDTTVVDTTQSEPVQWTIAWNDVSISDSRVCFRTANDTMAVDAAIRLARVRRGSVDLGAESYRLRSIELRADSVNYDMTYAPRTEGLDYNHLGLKDVSVLVDDFDYIGGNLSLFLKELGGRERSGLEICQGNARVTLADEALNVQDLLLTTANSELMGQVHLPWQALETGGGEPMSASLWARVGMQDVALAVPAVGNLLPPTSATLRLQAAGDADRLRIDTLTLAVESVLWADARGEVTHLRDSLQRGGRLGWQAKTYDTKHLSRMAALPPSVRVPQIVANGRVRMQGTQLGAEALVREGKGRLEAKAEYNIDKESYALRAETKDLNLQHFLPQDSLTCLDSRIELKGRGTDFMSRLTRLSGFVRVDKLTYGRYDFGGLHVGVKMQGGHADVEFAANNPLLMAQACVEADFMKKLSLARFSLSLNRADLYALGLTKKPLAMSLHLQADGSTDFKRNHHLTAGIRAFELQVADTVYYPRNVDVALTLTPDTTRAWAQAGDLKLDFQSLQSLEKILGSFSQVSEELDKQIKKRELNQAALLQLLPRASVSLTGGPNNPFSNILRHASGISFEKVDVNLQSDDSLGLNGGTYLTRLHVGGLQLDTIRMDVVQDTSRVLNAHLHVANNAKNKQVVFRSDIRTALAASGVDFSAVLFDAHGRKGVDIGARLDVEEQGLRLHLTPLKPVLAYRTFTLNPNNYVFLSTERHLEADVNLLADDGTGFKLYTMPNEESLQDITLSMHDVNLGELTSVFPYMPAIEGMLRGDVHFVQDEQNMSLSVDANVNKLAYEGAPFGNVGLNVTYFPNADGTHFVDGIVTHEGNEIATLSGSYDAKHDGVLDAEATLQHLPLSLANGFVDAGLLDLQGYADAWLQVNGPASRPVMNGQLSLDSVYVNSRQYSVNLRFPNDTLVMQNSMLNFNRIEAYTKSKTPLVLDGRVDCRNLESPVLDLNVRASDFELMNAPKSRHAVAYGKVYVDLASRVTGTPSDMQVRGRLAVLSKTNVYYVLTDSPLTVEDQLADLVTFVDFTEEEEPQVTEVVKPQNMDVRMQLSIEPAAQVHVLLSEDGQNDVNIEGGGDLTLTYSLQNDLKLYGRYTVLSGSLNYSLMVMSLRDCRIKQGSYVEFTGPVTNPRLNISATERVKTTVYEEKVPRSVAFDVGIELSKTLADMGMSFTIDAPEDLTVSNQLASMGADGRGKVAVTMLATGMYLTDEGSAQGFSGTNALNSFLQTQIAGITNKAFKTIDLNFGVDNLNTASGATQTDYNFSFAKRFWGNRISLIVGGKVSSGSEAQNTGQSIVDNVSIEYRLDNSATRYVRLYYDRNTESLIEGEVMEMGAGLVLRKKSTRLGELFIFRKKKEGVEDHK